MTGLDNVLPHGRFAPVTGLFLVFAALRRRVLTVSKVRALKGSTVQLYVKYLSEAFGKNRNYSKKQDHFNFS